MKILILTDTDDPAYVVNVIVEPAIDMFDVAKFEIQRIQSLQSRKIKVKTESRIWDQKRRITVGVKE